MLVHRMVHSGIPKGDLNGCEVFTVENRKGGVGKTTTAVALAVGLARHLYEDGGGNVLA